ncbi:hypothetical protein BDZ91DRAFT_755537 [Kalaharituber pfeilii]|nr:hypothetical protein BDZ91DRAFT_755537 [Kalaharituber pfeilii]
MWFLWLIWSQVCNCRNLHVSVSPYDPINCTNPSSLPRTFLPPSLTVRLYLATRLQRRSAHLGRSPLLSP